MSSSPETVAPLLGAEIRRLREEKGWTLRELASKVGLDFGYIGKIERGENARVETYRSIAAALGISLSTLTTVADGGRRAAPRRMAARTA